MDLAKCKVLYYRGRKLVKEIIDGGDEIGYSKDNKSEILFL